MVDPIDDIERQARQGSVSAVIQVLNERLADAGVRTRAVLDHGVLQLLCEAETPAQLDQQTLTEEVRYILERLSPQGIRRVNINSRIVREQQLLWLEDIQRDPKKQLLWSQEITLPPQNPLKRMLEDWRYNRMVEGAKPAGQSPTEAREQKQFWRGILIGGLSLGVLALLVGWALADWLGVPLPRPLEQLASPASPEVAEPAPTPSPTPDPFVQAVRLAELAAQDGQSAQTSADWLDLASRWQRAADLMAQVPATDSRYTTAQNRTELYRENSNAALQQAERLR
ncbi:MAG: hypothetical protein Fur0046_32870 [Cyanobacteria bacterium J069]|nr:MAG: hypothetical protein D6742_06535 [Cyanobacteria bacterium J069]